MIFKVLHGLPDGRYLVEGEFKDLPLDKVVTIEFEDESRIKAVVQTKTTAGVVVKAI